LGQEFLKLLNDFDKTPSITLREWHRVLNHILNNLVSGSYITTVARNVSIDDAGNYFSTKHVEYALQYLALSLLNFKTRITTKTETANLTSSEFGVILCDSDVAMTLNLPPVSGLSGNTFYITNINNGTVDIEGSGSETIQGDTTFKLYKDENIQIICTGSAWYIR